MIIIYDSLYKIYYAYIGIPTVIIINKNNGTITAVWWWWWWWRSGNYSHLKRVALRTHIPFRLNTHGAYSSSVLLTRSNNERRTVKQVPRWFGWCSFFPIRGLGPLNRLWLKEETTPTGGPRGGLTSSPLLWTQLHAQQSDLGKITSHLFDEEIQLYPPKEWTGPCSPTWYSHDGSGPDTYYKFNYNWRLFEISLD